jgi:hypothetical protein
MNNKRGRKKKDYIKVFSSIPPSTHRFIEQNADSRGLDIAAIIRETLIEKFGKEAVTPVASVSEKTDIKTGSEPFVTEIADAKKKLQLLTEMSSQQVTEEARKAKTAENLDNQGTEYLK